MFASVEDIVTRYEEHGRDNTSTWTRNEVTSAWTIQEHSDDTISIHEQSECYTCKQYECNEYVRSALARSKVTIRVHVRGT
jgi:queuine/archaeosine tRNA-ribosyltransferase